MSKDPEAHIYYGFTQSRDKYGEFIAHSIIKQAADGDANANEALETIDQYEDEEDSPHSDDDPWDQLHASIRWEKETGLRVGLIGHDENLGFYICVVDSFRRAEWAEVVDLDANHFKVDPTWADQLKAAVKEYELNVQESEPGWHLTALWF